MTLRIEFGSADHPVGRVVREGLNRVVDETARLIASGRRDGSIPPGPPTRKLALALTGALEGSIISVAGQAPHDEVIAERVTRGVLGLQPAN